MTEAEAFAESGAEPTLRELAVERSLAAARAKAVSRSERFIATATELLSETGRTDFTVQELVERSKTSLRSFYQHFRSKDELMLALFEEIMTNSTQHWRENAAAYGDEVEQLHYLVTSLYSRSTSSSLGGATRALTSYHLQLAESRPTEYARVLSPLRDAIFELVEAGVRNGAFRNDMDPETLAVVLLQTLTSAAHMHSLGAEFTGEPLDAEKLWAFCLGALTSRVRTEPLLRRPRAPRLRSAGGTRSA